MDVETSVCWPQVAPTTCGLPLISSIFIYRDALAFRLETHGAGVLHALQAMQD